ncbi:MAG: undecaprenyl-diphosphate phosphatase [Clostridia bacterium]|nr:undecaprenyl-diphosphate phosphatase [Clostridia bacterium]
MTDYILAALQGIVQGLTEFLPVSSSGHLNIFQHFTGLSGEGNLFFNVMLHLGTLVAVCAFYYKLIFRLIKAFGSMVKKLFTGKLNFKKLTDDENLLLMLVIGLLPLFLLFVPIGNDMKIKDLADILTGDKSYFIVTGLSLLLTSVLLFTSSKVNRKNEALAYQGKTKLKSRYRVPDALTVGMTQCVAAILPGLSRSGSTLAAGQFRSIKKQDAMDYTFVLAIPSIVAAAALELLDAIKAPEGLSVDIGPVIVGVIFSAVVGYFSIALFKWLLKTDRTYIFVIYTAIMGLVVIGVSIYEMITASTVCFTFA